MGKGKEKVLIVEISGIISEEEKRGLAGLSGEPDMVARIKEKLRSLADGRIYTAQQALEYGLIDQIGYLDEAITLAKKEAEVTKARVIIYHRPGAYKNNIYSQLSNSSFSTINLFNIDLKTFIRSGTPSFMYLWAP